MDAVMLITKEKARIRAEIVELGNKCRIDANYSPIFINMIQDRINYLQLVNNYLTFLLENYDFYSEKLRKDVK